jgi:hypothetical protein
VVLLLPPELGPQGAYSTRSLVFSPSPNSGDHQVLTLILLSIIAYLLLIIMGLGNELSREERSEIIGAHKHGVPLKEISHNIQKPYATVKYTWRKSNERPHDQSDIRRSGRPRILSPTPELLTMGSSVEAKKAALKQALLDGWEVVRADIGDLKL